MSRPTRTWRYPCVAPVPQRRRTESPARSGRRRSSCFGKHRKPKGMGWPTQCGCLTRLRRPGRELAVNVTVLVSTARSHRCGRLRRAHYRCASEVATHAPTPWSTARPENEEMAADETQRGRPGGCQCRPGRPSLARPCSASSWAHRGRSRSRTSSARRSAPVLPAGHRSDLGLR